MQTPRRVVERILGFAAAALLVAGLAGQAFEMRGIRLAGGPAPASVFADRRNLKCYALIGAGTMLWYAAGQIQPHLYRSRLNTRLYKVWYRVFWVTPD